VATTGLEILATFVEVTTTTAASAGWGVGASASDELEAVSGIDTLAIAISSDTLTDGDVASATSAEPARTRNIGREKNTVEATAATASRARSHF